jgi:exodeoxyribonuclease VII large subunit
MLETGSTHIFSVSELTRDVRLVLEGAFQGVWVEGEISNFKGTASGHFYFSLKDENAVMNCVLFKGNSFKVKFEIQDGMKVVLFGRVSVYDKKGQYQLYVETVEPRGKGALHVAFEQLKEKLFKEGLFDERRKKPLPFLPLHIGVVTSATGAAVRDIVKVAKRRYPEIEITVCPVKVQGDEAKGEIARAIEMLNGYNKTAGAQKGENPIEVMIVGRGGGSVEDLWAFNEEEVARAIAASGIPVVSAVGHEIDYTISDLVADRRAATPSQAAELVVPEKEELKRLLNGLKERADAALKSKIELCEERLRGLEDAYILRSPENFILQKEQELDELSRDADEHIRRIMEKKGTMFEAAVGKFEALSPVAVLARGYSITFKGDKVLRGVSSVRKGDKINTRIGSGGILSVVEEITE